MSGPVPFEKDDLEIEIDQWVENLFKLIKDLAILDGVDLVFDELSKIPRVVQVRRRDDVASPLVRATVEPWQAIVDIDNFPNAGLLYEFDGRPRELRDRWQSARTGPGASGSDVPWLSEVDLVGHVLGSLLVGNRYARFPLYDRIEIPGYGPVVSLNSGSFDLGWPPVVIKKWSARPSGVSD